jgi:hypothetical protein
MQATIQREKREEAILSTLAKLHYLSRSQLQRIHRLGSDRNARRVLQGMKDYLYSFRDGENIYYLNAEGRQRIGSQKVTKRTIQARHYLMRNELYIALNQPVTWKNEMKIQSGKITIICDALYKNGNQYVFIEVDHTQRMNKNKVKIQKYKSLINAGVFKTHPELFWVTTTEHRRRALLKECAGMMNVRVFTIEDLR